MSIEWKDTYIYGEQYQVSQTGLVRNKITGHILTPQKDNKGYLRVRLSFHNKKSSAKVHRLVAVAFIPNPYNKPQVNHRDANKENNAVGNLEWITNYENMQHAIRNGLTNHVEYAGRKKRAVIGTSLDGKHIVKFSSLSEAAKTCRISRSNLCNTLKGKRKMCGGYTWSYENESEVTNHGKETSAVRL